MEIEWDDKKRTRNLTKHGVDFAMIYSFNWNIALTREDTRLNYGEIRFVSISLVGDRHYVAVWTIQNDIRRLISLRKANKREVTGYVKN